MGEGRYSLPPIFLDTMRGELMFEEYLLLIIGDSYNSTLGKMYIDISKNMIMSYLNVDYLEDGLYTGAIVMLSAYLYNNAEMLGLSQRKEGDITLSLESIDIPKQIKAMLPKPKVRFV